MIQARVVNPGESITQNNRERWLTIGMLAHSGKNLVPSTLDFIITSGIPSMVVIHLLLYKLLVFVMLQDLNLVKVETFR